jgi:hypothetical protein
MELRLTSPVGIDAVPSAVTVIQTESMHDVVTARIQAQTFRIGSVYRSGTPLQIDWTDGRGMRGRRYCYCDRITTPRVYDSPPGLRTKYSDIIAFGPTYTLKNEGMQTWDNLVSDPIVKGIVTTQGLAAFVDASSYRWESLAQGGKSDWALLRAMADTIGFALISRDTSVFFVDRRLVIARAKPISYVVDDGNSGDVLHFEPTESDGAGGVGGTPGRRTIRGVSQYSGLPFVLGDNGQTSFYGAVKNAPLFDRNVPGVANSVREALALLDGAVGANMFNREARLVVVGNAAIRPGSVLSIAFPGSDDDSGLWYVREARHIVSATNYTTDALIVRDGYGVNQNTVPLYGAQLRDVQTKSLPNTVFRNGRWMAAWSTK